MANLDFIVAAVTAITVGVLVLDAFTDVLPDGMATNAVMATAAGGAMYLSVKTLT